MSGVERLLAAGGSRPSRVSAVALDPGSRRYSFYSPEMDLLAESELTTAAAPVILYEYVWFNGHPVGQLDGGTSAHWTFTDHLGTPLLQTDSTGAVYWRAEHEPYGSVFELRTADQHQPLRFPGQEAEQLNLGDNGLTDRSYNIHRWYRSTWGRYTQDDPLRQPSLIAPFLSGSPIWHTSAANQYAYTGSKPVSYSDPLGLYEIRQAGRCKAFLEGAFKQIERGRSKGKCNPCEKYAADHGRNLESDITPGGPPYIFVIPEDQGPLGPGICGGASGDIMFINEKCCVGKGPCDIGSLLLHELLHQWRKDTQDIEDQQGFKACKFGCFNPGILH